MIPQSFPLGSVTENKALLREAIDRVLDSGWYVLGPEVERFEAGFAAYVGVGHGVGVANGTDAVELALRALDVGAGDAVAVVSHTAVATVAAIRATGATPLWVDIDPDTCVMTPATLDAALRDAPQPPKAVIAVHLYGNMVAPEETLATCRAHGLPLVEDCAQAHGALYDGCRAGSFGDIAAFSFYPTKNLGALGDGGAVVSADAALAERVRVLRQYGWKERYVSAEVGLNSRLDPIQAAILDVLLPRLDAANAARRAVAAIYRAELGDLAEVRLPEITAGVTPVYHQFVIQVAERDGLADFLRRNGVATAIHYPVPVHRQPAYAGLHPPETLAATDAVAGRILSLPMYPQLEPDTAKRVTDLVRAFVCRTA